MPLNLCDVGVRPVRLAGTPGDVHGLTAQQFDEAVDAHRPSRADVEDLSRDVGGRRGKQRVDDVCHEREIANLGAIADDGEWLALQLLRQKHAQHRAIRARRAGSRAVHIEESQRHDGAPVDPRPVERVLFAEILREGIRILRPDGRRFRRRVCIGDAVTRG